jgi:molybdate transport system substrate-binding protein
MKKSLRVLLAALLLLTAGCTSRPAPYGENSQAETTAVELNISAASSLKEASEAVKKEYTAAHPDIKITYNFASSGTLQKQIEEGAPVDLFISAGTAQMDALAAQNLILADSRKDLLGNELVLIVAKDSALKDFGGLTDPAVKKLSIGTPETVPAGQYARETLISMQLYERVKSKLVLAKDVRQVLTYVETGNAEAGLVYRSDTFQVKNVRIAAAAPPDSHKLIVYPMAVVKASKQQQAARNFADFLTSPQAAAVFEKYGFKVLGRN